MTRAVIISLYLSFGLALSAADGPQAGEKSTSSSASVDFIRKMVFLPSDERKEALEALPFVQRNILKKWLGEYDALTPPEREVRLQTFELRFYLPPLLSLPASERPARLAKVPDHLKTLVGKRLQEWDRFSSSDQQKFLQNRKALHLFATARRKPILMASNSNQLPESLKKLEQSLEAWNELPEPKRLQITEQFHRFFELSFEERQKALLHLSEAERQLMEDTLQQFRNMPSEQRIVILKSFERLAKMKPAERNQFLFNATLWSQLSPDERQEWRQLVSDLPPLPYEDEVPPFPPGLKSRRSVEAGSLPPVPR